MKKLFSIVDIETNGGFSKTGKITEIAIFITDGEKIISEYSTLINPESYIPPFIEDLTGISNEMVENAPKFYEVAKDIVEITKDTVFVAHNSRFDYSFVKQEFANLGYDYVRETLCTLSLSRKFFKGLRSYSLGNICKDFDIELKDRHRAFGDARATVELFNMILKYDLENFEGININGFPIKGFNDDFDLKRLNSLPERFGVFYFYNSEGEVIYVGKSKDIKYGVLSFFKNKKNNNIKSEIVDMDYELTGCELITQIKETEEIFKKSPKYNKRKRKKRKWGICTYEDEKGYLRLNVFNTDESDYNPVVEYLNKKNADDALGEFCTEYGLCKKLCGLYESAGACFYYGLGECKGACCGKEPADEYNNRVKNLINDLSFGLENAYIVFDNCENDKTGIVVFKNNTYNGYVLLDKESDIRMEDIEDVLKQRSVIKGIDELIFSYLKNYNGYRIIHYKDK